MKRLPSGGPFAARPMRKNFPARMRREIKTVSERTRAYRVSWETNPRYTTSDTGLRSERKELTLAFSSA